MLFPKAHSSLLLQGPLRGTRTAADVKWLTSKRTDTAQGVAMSFAEVVSESVEQVVVAELMESGS